MSHIKEINTGAKQSVGLSAHHHSFTSSICVHAFLLLHACLCDLVCMCECLVNGTPYKKRCLHNEGLCRLTGWRPGFSAAVPTFPLWRTPLPMAGFDWQWLKCQWGLCITPTPTVGCISAKSLQGSPESLNLSCDTAHRGPCTLQWKVKQITWDTVIERGFIQPFDSNPGESRAEFIQQLP